MDTQLQHCQFCLLAVCSHTSRPGLTHLSYFTLPTGLYVTTLFDTHLPSYLPGLCHGYQSREEGSLAETETPHTCK